MIPITKPMLGKEEAASVSRTILSGWVTQGPKVKEFEKKFAEYVNAKFACAVSSCTTALHLALVALNVKQGDVVITVSHSFIATANAIRHCGAEPVFVDIDRHTYNMSTKALKNFLTNDCEKISGLLYYKNIPFISTGESVLKSCSFVRKTSTLGRIAAIMPVHQMGIPCDIKKIVDIANQYNLPVIEDAACAIGSEISSDKGNSWQKIGKPHGKVACFSFHPRKIITTGDGGMITTNSSDLDAKFRLLRQHGMSVPDTVRHISNKVIFEEYVTTAFNYRLTDIQAAVGIEQMQKLNDIVEKRRKLASIYNNLLNGHKYLHPFIKNDNTFIRLNWQSFPVRIHNESPLNQIQIMEKLLDKGVATRRGIMNIHQEPAYINPGWFLPESELCRDTCFLLPLYPEMTTNDIKFVVDVLTNIFN